MFRAFRYVAFAFVLSLACIGSASAAVDAPQIHVFKCQVISGVEVPRTDEIGLLVRFRNDSSDLSSIVWRAKYGPSYVDFIDDGTFSSQVQIDNSLLFELGTTRFNWGAAALDTLALVAHTAPSQSVMSSNMKLPLYMSSEDPENCQIVRTISAHGDVWLNPAVSQDAPAVPTPAPARSRHPSVSPSASPAPTPVTTTSKQPVEVQHCKLSIDGRVVLETTFTVESQSADRVELRAAYGSGAIAFTDEGNFAPGVPIVHYLKLPMPAALKGRSYVAFDDPHACAVAVVHFADGTSWQNPLLPASPPPLPTPPPNAIDRIQYAPRWSQRHSMPTPVPSATPSATPAPSS